MAPIKSPLLKNTCTTSELNLDNKYDAKLLGESKTCIVSSSKSACLLIFETISVDERKVTFESEKIIVSKEDSTEKFSNGKIEVGRKLNIRSWEDFLKGIILQ